VQDLNVDKVDVIVCNPPYFKNGLLNNNEQLKKARHEESLTIEEVVVHSHRLLKGKGRLVMIYKTSELINLIILLDKYGFGITKLKLIVDSNKEYSNTVLIEAVKGLKHNLKALKPLVINH
jgi:tRNA1(Val) A37 N6-methylase TrmN6